MKYTYKIVEKYRKDEDRVVFYPQIKIGMFPWWFRMTVRRSKNGYFSWHYDVTKEGAEFIIQLHKEKQIKKQIKKIHYV